MIKIAIVFLMFFLFLGCDETASSTDRESGKVYALDGNEYIPLHVNVGSDKSIYVGDSVSFKATVEHEFDIKTYEWKIDDTFLSDKEEFSTASVRLGTYTITLNVTDVKGNFFSDMLMLQVEEKEIVDENGENTENNETIDTNIAPIAKAGDDQSMQEGSSILFNGAQSSDSDGNLVSFQWKEGNTLLSTDIAFSKSNFSLGTHTIILTVTDNAGSSSSDSIVIEIVVGTNTLPVARAGENQSVNEGEEIIFSALDSVDDDGDIASYRWTYVGECSLLPTDCESVLSTNATFSKSDFKVGIHQVTLHVTDNDGAISTDSIEVTVKSTLFVPETLTFKTKTYYTVKSPYSSRIWLDRNLGASEVCSTYSDQACYGNYYQWGRKTDGHEISSSDITTLQSTSVTTNSSNFIRTDFSHNYDWAYDVDIDGSLRLLKWGGVNQNTLDDNSICPADFRIPTIAEIRAEFIDAKVYKTTATESDKAEMFNHFLKIPLAGLRNEMGILSDTAEFSHIWSQSMDTANNYSYALHFAEDNHSFAFVRGYGIPVRCIKD